MPALHAADRHEALAAAAWDADEARAALREIVADVERACRDGHRWPVHPQDDDGDPPSAAYHSLYLGGAGVVWALWFLQRVGACDTRLDLDDAIRRIDAAYAAAPDTGEVVPSYYLGEVGILLVRWRIGGDAAVADRLFDAVRANIPNPTNEALWAAPGTMVAAWQLWRATADERWRALFVDNVEQVWRTWHDDAASGLPLWTQDLYGRTMQYLGAGHGFAGNVLPLLKGAALLDDARRAALVARTERTLQATAVHDGDAVNWRSQIAPPSPGRPPFLMQWCHGAPGIVTGLVDLPVGASPTLDSLLLGAGEAIWRAGPLTKGAGLCHGTAGNALALRALHQRTGDARWLERARAFVMHAAGQRRQASARDGQGRYTLWTGDLGLAVALWLCGDGADTRRGMPGLDFID